MYTLSVIQDAEKENNGFLALKTLFHRIEVNLGPRKQHQVSADG